jgi:hypothetical protein
LEVYWRIEQLLGKDLALNEITKADNTCPLCKPQRIIIGRQRPAFQKLRTRALIDLPEEQICPYDIGYRAHAYNHPPDWGKLGPDEVVENA